MSPVCFDPTGSISLGVCITNGRIGDIINTVSNISGGLSNINGDVANINGGVKNINRSQITSIALEATSFFDVT